MLRSFLLADGSKIVDGVDYFPDPGPINWHREYSCNDADTVHRIAPIFPDVGAAVDWLRRLIEKRQEGRQVLPRRRFPDLLTGKEALEYPAGPGLGVTHQYEGYAETDFGPVPALLFRGQTSTEHPAISTLLRAVWPAMVHGDGDADRAIEALHTAEKITARFAREFFSDKALKRQFDWLPKMETARRAAVARHYGFGSWVLDFTVDPAVAAIFAGGSDSGKDPYGCIVVLDEQYLESIFNARPLIQQHTGFQSRTWRLVDVAKLEAATTVTVSGHTFNFVGAHSFLQEMLDSGKFKDGFQIANFYTPGIEVERMWQQKWCGVEIGDPRESIVARILSAQIALRLYSRVFFLKSATKIPGYERLLANTDPFSVAVNAWRVKEGLAPAL
jgi:hypothetical protein